VPAARKELDKDAFLKLLVTQLSNQDPLSPVDNQAFIAQLAQFSSVEQLTAVGRRLDTLLLAQASANQLQTASLVGKDVLFRSDRVELGATGDARLQASVAGAAEVTAVVKDASGKVVRNLSLGKRPGGALDFAWDGRDADGRRLPAGSYAVELSARGGDGGAVLVDLRQRGRVQGVRFDGDAPLLLVGSSQVRLADVLEITQP
jgi:flagellar basal-body rod modification protein FlgD